MRRTKIICTLGPASRSRETLVELIEAGMDIARINMSHGLYEEHGETIELVRELAAQTGRRVEILGDLQGPKIRLGEVAGTPRLERGQKFVLSVEPHKGDADGASVDYAGFCQDVLPGGKIYINDGLIELKVIAVKDKEVRTEVISGGEIKSHKGVNLPGAKLNLPAFTAKDRRDLGFLTSKGVDYIACSFIRRAENILDIKEAITESGADTPLIAKLETGEGVSNSRQIMEAAAGIMIARGDMAVELPFEEIPLIQQILLDLGREMDKPVIVATQMLESMLENPTPTRAEMTDVSNAVRYGAWAVMLSAETAAGRHPVEAVKVMARLAAKTEAALADGKIDLEDLDL